MEHMENRVMMSANPICNVVAHNLDIGAVPALVAENLPGTGLATASRGVVHPLSPITPPAAPSPMALPLPGGTYGGNIGLTWNSVSGATGYVVEVWVPAKEVRWMYGRPVMDPAHWEQIASLGSGATGYEFNVGQNVAYKYTFRVAATNSAGTTWSAPVSSDAEYIS
jgi:hypothetical protein